MNKKKNNLGSIIRNLKVLKNRDITSAFVLWVFLMVIALTTIEIFYYSFQSEYNAISIEQKIKAVSLIQLPDIAPVTEAVWLRHRSLSSVFSIFPDDGSLLDYYPASFVYQPGQYSGNKKKGNGSIREDEPHMEQ